MYNDFIKGYGHRDPGRGDLLQKIAREESNLKELKYKHPEYFI